ncbi:MAG TPA: cytochrome P460 family protein [Candidatus Sulfotelmatobacter sp.]
MRRIAYFVQPVVWCSLRVRVILRRMISKSKALLLFVVVALVSLAALCQNAAPANSGTKNSEPHLAFPEHYREWVYLTTGFDMSYTPGAAADHHMFDNVFVNPEAYKSFTETGTWPDKTVLVLEVRGAKGKGSINQRGNYQDTEVMGLEVHAKDEARFPGKWAFFGFDDAKVSKMVPTSASCYSCHADHAAVDTTFVQFYPTLLPTAKAKGTFSAAYLKDPTTPIEK